MNVEPAPEPPVAPPGLLRFLDKRSDEREAQSIPRCETVIFVATRTEEKALEFAAREQQLSLRRCVGEGDQRYLDLGLIREKRTLAVQTAMGPLIARGSVAQAIQWRQRTGANSLISMGMAFGIRPQQQRLGDIVIAEGVLPYDIRIIRTGANGSPVADYRDVAAYPSNKELRERFESHALNERWRGRTWSGLLLSGAARIHCAAFRDELAAACASEKASVIGGDMESAGLLSASDAPADPCWIVVKAISDFADDQRDGVIKKARPVACYNSARFVLGAL